jgi:hypothetical protein
MPDMPRGGALFDGELSLSEMLADPIVQAVMARDGTTGGEVAALIDKVRRGFANPRPDAPQAGRGISSHAVCRSLQGASR